MRPDFAGGGHGADQRRGTAFERPDGEASRGRSATVYEAAQADGAAAALYAIPVEMAAGGAVTNVPHYDQLDRGQGQGPTPVAR